MITLEEPKVTIVPAAPGFLVHYVNDDAPFLQRPGESVVAWAVSHTVSDGEVSTSVTPITIDTLAGNRYFIEQPNGAICAPQSRMYASFEEAERDLALGAKLLTEERERRRTESGN